MKKLGLVGAFVLVVLGCGCGGGGDDAGGGGAKNPNDVKTTGGTPAAITAFTKRDDSLTVDQIGPSDGALKPDGKMDAAFDVTIRGPVISVLIDSADDDKWQWDTYTKTDDIPAGMKAFAAGGAFTGQVGVFEADKVLNKDDGSFALADGNEHKLVVYVSDTGAFVAGAKFKIYAETPDHKIVEGPVVTY